VDHLEQSLREAEALACRFEHITPSEVVEQLSKFLGDPEVSPGGKLIPAPGMERLELTSIPLTDFPIGETGTVRHMDVTESSRAYLHAEKIIPGATIRILAASSNGSLLLQVREHQIQLSKDLTCQIFIGAQA